MLVNASRVEDVVDMADFGIRITELDGDVSDELILETDCQDTRDRFHNSGFSVGYVSDRAQVYRSLQRVSLCGSSFL
jgi:hypothetical protein